MQIGDRIKSLRIEAGLTQAQLAQRIGVHGQSVSKWERNLMLPDLAVFAVLSKQFGVSLEALVGFDSEGRVYDQPFCQERISQAIIELRKGLGLSQAEFAAKISESSHSVSKWERGIIYPDIEKITKLATVFGVLPSDIYYGVIAQQSQEKPLPSEGTDISKDTKNSKKANKILVLLGVIILVLAIIACALVPVLNSHDQDSTPQGNSSVTNENESGGNESDDTEGDESGGNESDGTEGDESGGSESDDTEGDESGGSESDDTEGDESGGSEGNDSEDNEGGGNEDKEYEEEIAANIGLKIKLNSNGQSYTITGRGKCLDLRVAIPDSYNGLPVTAIADEAFKGDVLESITIPDSVTSIGEGAFFSCTSLREITLPKNLESIKYATFYKCSSLTSIEIPDSVTDIEYGAFYECSGLTAVVVANCQTNIGESAFFNCTSLTSVYLKWGEDSLDEKMMIGTNNFSFISAEWYHYSESQPALTPDGTLFVTGFWHYDKNGKINVWDAQELYVMPLKNYTVGTDYTEKAVYNETLKQWEPHKAIDFIADNGAEVRAALGGKVVNIKTDYLYGTVVTIEQSDGLVAIYKSLSEDVKVEIGQTVMAGAVIGYASQSMAREKHAGVHLHFEMQKDGVSVNPWDYLQGEENKDK